VAYRALTARLYPELHVSPRGFDYVHLRSILSFGLLSSALHISNALLYATDSLVIGAFLPVAMVTFFSIPGGLRGYSTQVISAMSAPMTPRASALRAQGADAHLRSVVLGTSALASLVVMPIAITLLIRGTSFISLWMGPEYAPVSGPLLIILAIPLLFTGTRQIAMSSLVGVNEHKKLVPFYVAEALLNLFLSIYWIRTMGIAGVALGTTVPTLATSLLVCPVLLRLVFGISLTSTWIRTWVLPGAAMVPFALMTYVCESRWQANHLIVFFLQVALTLPLAAAGAWFVAMTPDQKDDGRAAFERLRSRARALLR
jgi:O-antigen/teichoic acid export membrane protein